MVVYWNNTDKAAYILISIPLKRDESPVTTVPEAELDTKDVLDSVMKRGISSPKGNQTLLIHDITSNSAE